MWQGHHRDRNSHCYWPPPPPTHTKYAHVSKHIKWKYSWGWKISKRQKPIKWSRILPCVTISLSYTQDLCNFAVWPADEIVGQNGLFPMLWLCYCHGVWRLASSAAGYTVLAVTPLYNNAVTHAQCCQNKQTHTQMNRTHQVLVLNLNP